MPTFRFLSQSSRFKFLRPLLGVVLAFFASIVVQIWIASAATPDVSNPFQSRTLSPPQIATGSVGLVITPLTTTAVLGQNFVITVQLQAGAQQVDGAAAYLNFDATRLQVVNRTPGATFPLVLQNTVDNTAGHINFAAGSLSPPFPSGNFTLLTITFNAITVTQGTSLTFDSIMPRNSDVTFGGVSVLGGTSPGTIVIKQKTTTSIVVSSAKNPSVLGEPVIFTATLTPSSGASPSRAPRDITPTGTVTFTIDSTLNVTRAIGASSVVTYETSTLAAGAHTIVAMYGGDMYYVGSTSLVFIQNVNNPVPTVTGINPVAINAGSPAFTLTVTGTNFVNGAVVRWGSYALPTTFVNSTRITAAVDTDEIKTPRAESCTVHNPLPGGGVSNAVLFTINNYSLYLPLIKR